MSITTEFEDTKKGKIISVYCYKCDDNRNQTIKKNLDLIWKDKYFFEDGDFADLDGFDDYQILRCNGCNAISFRHLTYFSEAVDFDSDGTSEFLYPKGHKKKISTKSFPSLPPVLRRIYRETVDCINNESFTLSAAGLRALVEGLCSHLNVKEGSVEENGKIVKKSNLEGKICGLAEKGILTNSSAEVLHEHRFLGNEAVHELVLPSLDELLLAMEILEHTLMSVFEMPNIHVNLRTMRTERLKKRGNKNES